MKLVRTRTIAPVIALIVATTLFGPISPASASQAHNNLDPVSSGCASGASTIRSYPMTNDISGMHITNLEVRYSPACGTNWIRVNNPYPSGTVSTHMYIYASNGNEAFNVPNTNTGDQWTPMVYAPGATCVTVYASLLSGSSTVAGGGPGITIC